MKHLLSAATSTATRPSRSSTPRHACTRSRPARSRSCRRCADGRWSTCSSRTPPAPARSFEIAGKWLSADVINVSAKGSSVSKGESLRDTVLTVAAMGVDALVVRHHASGAVQRLAGWVDCHVVNAGDGTHEHPTQALLDAYTLRSRLGELADRHVVIVGDITHSRVARSNVLLLDTLGARVTLVAPPTLMPSGVEHLAVRDQLGPRRRRCRARRTATSTR